MQLMSPFGRLCCKTLFGSLTTIFPGCGRGDRIWTWGTTSFCDELTGDFGGAFEATSTDGRCLFCYFAEKSPQAIFGVLQHNRHETDLRPCPQFGRYRGESGRSAEDPFR